MRNVTVAAGRMRLYGVTADLKNDISAEGANRK
jgi:hypothetical protein